MFPAWIYIVQTEYFSFSNKDLGVTQSLHGNVYKFVNYEGQVTDLCHALQFELACILIR